jgi:hypothetical protein
MRILFTFVKLPLRVTSRCLSQICRHMHICCTFHVGRLGAGDGPTRNLGIVMEGAADAECGCRFPAPTGVSKRKTAAQGRDGGVQSRPGGC